MDRKEFLKTSLKTGACACAMMVMGNGDFIFADDEKENNKTSPKEDKKKKSEEEKKQAFISDWTESLMVIMDQNLDEKTKAKIMNLSGRKCAERTFLPVAVKYKGKPQELLKYMESTWAEKALFDEKTGVIVLKGKKTNKCFCPLAAGKQTFKTGTFCLCSKGWMSGVFETVSGKKARVEFINTVLTGADHCAFKITLT